MTGGKVLVIGDDTRSFLATVRSLGRQGVTVHAAPSNFRSPALRSRYIATIHDLPPWMGAGAEWLGALTQLLRAERYDLVIPCNETALLPLQRYREALSRFARLAIPHDRAIALLFDKIETRTLAQQVGVRIAAGRLLSPTDTADGLLTEFGSPVVLKPRRSYSLEQLAARGKVEVIEEPARLERLLGTLDPGETIVESYFSGQGVGVSVLAGGGRVLQAFQHHRVREIAGESFYRHSAPLSPEFVAACEAIVAGSDYTGVAMFEFKKKPSGDWILLEVNARPWGSMPLPVALGVDFPYRWYRLLTAAEEAPALPYRTGVYGRNLLPDLHVCLRQAEARGLGPVRNGLAYHPMGSGNVPHPNRKRGSRRLGPRRPTPWCGRTVCPGSGGGWGDRTPIARRRCPAPPPRSRRIEQIAAEHRQPRHRLRMSGKYLPQSVCRGAAAGAPGQLLCSDKLRRVDAAARTVDSDRWTRGRIGARRRSLRASLRLAEPKYGRDRIAGRRIRRNYAVRYIRPLSGYKGAGNSPRRSRAARRYHGSDRRRRR